MYFWQKFKLKKLKHECPTVSETEEVIYFLRPKTSDQFPNMGMGAYAFGYTANSPRPVRPITLTFPQKTNFTQTMHFVQSISYMHKNEIKQFGLLK